MQKEQRMKESEQRKKERKNEREHNKNMKDLVSQISDEKQENIKLKMN